jgi:2,3-bisphosphoglycerate-independent phosphoglycerate mutase
LQDLIRELKQASTRKIILLVLDGLGGIGTSKEGKTALEAADTPTMDQLASEGTQGLLDPIRPGVTPGSGPAHLSLFGYDPLRFDVGRGVLEATGVGLEVARGDLAARGNFCTLDDEGNIQDRRAGRIASSEANPLVDRLTEIEISGVNVQTKHVREYRFAIVFRGEELSADIADTDPQQTGVPPLTAKAENHRSEKAAEVANQWIDTATEILRNEIKANGVTLRGFSSNPELPTFQEMYGLNPACIAVYPMYRGVSKLVGMEICQFKGDTPADEFSAAAKVWDQHDFLFIHIKKTDSMGEDGNFQGKVEVIEKVDSAMRELMNLKPDVLAITGDHSTPSGMKSHSWHPVPLLLWAPRTARGDQSQGFGERTAMRGGLGRIHGTALMPLLLAHAQRLKKFGA